MVIASCCVNLICLSSSFKAIKMVFCCPCELLSKMRSFGHGFKPDAMFTFSSPSHTHFTVTHICCRENIPDLACFKGKSFSEHFVRLAKGINKLCGWVLNATGS